MNEFEVSNSAQWTTLAKAGLPTAFNTYISAIADNHCPYLNPAVEQNFLYVASIELDTVKNHTDGKSSELLFALAIAWAERLRILRADTISPYSFLIAQNIVIKGSESLDPDSARNLIEYAHYFLKDLYTEVGLMFGKFWTGEKDTDKFGKTIPSPPLTFLSIRSAIKIPDTNLLGQPKFQEILQASHDDGRNVLAEYGLDQHSTVDSIFHSDLYRDLERKLHTQRNS